MRASLLRFAENDICKICLLFKLIQVFFTLNILKWVLGVLEGKGGSSVLTTSPCASSVNKNRGSPPYSSADCNIKIRGYHHVHVSIGQLKWCYHHIQVPIGQLKLCYHHIHIPNTPQGWKRRLLFVCLCLTSDSLACYVQSTWS